MFVFPTEVTHFRKLPDPSKPNSFLKDEYGRFKFEVATIKVACDLRTNVTKDREGNEVSTFLDVDFPPDVKIGYGDEISYVDKFGNVHRGEVKTLEENTDPFGIKVYSRFATVG